MSRFREIKELGAGACGRAILVKDSETNERFVIKEIEFDGADELVKKSAINEIQIIKGIRHDNIINVYNATAVDGKVMILMEYADAGDLEKMIEKRGLVPFPEENLLDLFVQMCLAVKYIHDRKIIHRDIKPSNIFMCKGGIVKLGDFGFAKGLSSTHAEASTMIGTPYYVAPEIIKGRPYSMQVDIWSLGCILYEMATLRVPFEGDEAATVMHRIINTKSPKMPSRYCDTLRDLCARMLSKHPKKRPTINEILAIPLIRYKATALLGVKVADMELSHETFHGYAAGVTPESHKEHLAHVKLSVPKNVDSSPFIFMGRPLDLDGRQDPKDQAEYVEQFSRKIVGDKRYEELVSIYESNAQIQLAKGEESILELIDQLHEFRG